jgi:thiamine biosynthesis protein ThiI
MHPPGADTVLVRHGDVNTKSAPVKRYMGDLLRDNIAALLADRDLPGTVETQWSRLVIDTTTDDVAAATAAAATAFGVVSASACRTVAPDLESITDALAAIAQDRYDGGTFAVEATREDKERPFTSEDIGREGGSAIWDTVADEFDPEVDLEDPDLTFGVDVRTDAAYLYLDEVAGPGGLPLGSQAPLVALLSGGIDSPVAAYEMMNRGSPVVPVYVTLGQYGGIDHEGRAVETARTLADYAPNFDLRLHRVPGGDAVERLAATMDTGRMLSLRRFFYRVAEHVAEDVGASGVVTGEALGQKSSQTAQNLGVTSRVTDLPIHRPLLNNDKADIVARARDIGTFTDSTVDTGCHRLAPSQAETNARLAPLREQEPDDLFERAATAAANRAVIDP